MTKAEKVEFRGGKNSGVPRYSTIMTEKEYADEQIRQYKKDMSKNSFICHEPLFGQRSMTPEEWEKLKKLIDELE